VLEEEVEVTPVLDGEVTTLIRITIMDGKKRRDSRMKRFSSRSVSLR
jgi:hypothetical protein